MKKDDSLQTAYENEYSNFYDRMLYGSAISLEKMLELVPDWRGYIAVGFAYDLGLTGVVVDHEKARAYYHRAEEIGLQKATGDTRITLQEFRYARHLPFDNWRIPLTDRVKAAYRVLLCIIMTSRCEGANQLDVSYTAGLAYSYRLSRVAKHIPYETDPARQTEEDRELAAICEPMRQILDLYSKQDVKDFIRILEHTQKELQGEGEDTKNTKEGRNMERGARSAFTAFLLGLMLYDTYRCPIEKNTLIRDVTAEYRKLGAGLLWQSFGCGCTAALIYLADILQYSGMGQLIVPGVLDLAGTDYVRALAEKAEEYLGPLADADEKIRLVRRILSRHRAGEDRTGKYLVLY